MALSAIDTISLAFDHTKEHLFRPFRLGQWLRLALLGFMTGELSTGGSCNPGSLNDLKKIQDQTNGTSGSEQFLPTPHIDPHLIGPIFLGLGVALLLISVLILAWMYVGSVCRFILIESVISKRVSLREGWHKWHAAGRRFFLWRLTYQIVAGIFFAILVGVPFGLAAALGWFENPEEHILPIILTAVPFAFLILLATIVAVLVWLFAKDFMAPIMAVEDLDFADAWNILLAMMKKEKGAFAGYVGMKVVLAIAAEILFGIVIFIAVLLVALPGAIAGAAAVFAGNAAGLTWTAGTITLAIVAASMLFVVVMVLSAMLSVPVTLYFPAYSIYFLASRYPKLDAWLHPPPVAPGTTTPGWLPGPGPTE